MCKLIFSTISVLGLFILPEGVKEEFLLHGSVNRFLVAVTSNFKVLLTQVLEVA